MRVALRLESPDILDILRTTRTWSGTTQLRSYAMLIDKAIQVVAQNPDQRGAAAHCLKYTTDLLPDRTIGTIMLPGLHEGREPRQGRPILDRHFMTGIASQHSRSGDSTG